MYFYFKSDIFDIIIVVFSLKSEYQFDPELCELGNYIVMYVTVIYL